MKIWIGALAIFLASLPAYCAAGQDGERTVRELIELSGAKGQYQQTLVAMTQSIQTGFSAGLARALKERPLNPAQRQQAKAILDRHFSRFIHDFQAYMQKTMPWEKLVQEIYIPTYLKYFSTQELQNLIDFYRSPAGRKFAEKGPALSRDAALAISKAYGKDLQREAAKLTQDTLRQIGMELENLSQTEKE